MRKFTFPKWLIQKYSTSFIWFEETQGQYDTSSGKWVKGEETEREVFGAVIPYAETTQYQSGGTILSTDRQIISLKKMPNKAKIKYHDNLYTLTDATPYPEYADFFVYMARRVDVFDET